MTDLTIRRAIDAPPERLFDLWTKPDLLMMWWGPEGVVCTAAEIDLRVGGAYRIANRLPDGTTIWIAGSFERIERPNLLIYSWVIEGDDSGTERVTVRFEPRLQGSEIIILHENISAAAMRLQHEAGWNGCLDGLAKLVASHA